ncbi:MAG: crossover junction endodeoxyribonuclease RuvC [Ignavibacteria bacterium]|nr:crossover junction endodeoxyribonuclease RuvC [Ignavibacteria bacterium]
MVVLGVDPGTLITGYGVIEIKNGKAHVLTCGAIKNKSSIAMPNRLRQIYETLSEVITRFHPDEFAIETAFYGKNAQSALKLGHARGVSMLAAVSQNLPTHEYSPREVKKAIVGKGTASKEQVQYMVKSLLRLKAIPKEYDVTDALAVAICHTHRRTSIRGSHSFKSWKAYTAAHPEKLTSSRRMSAI